ncbi:hypothetical protein [Sulfitobacter sp. R18_1]|uniref:secretion/conjugation apparatus DotM-related subunit n=1 Tax=Sulfitobacter sp. R18_1 TaxID=2821104 RepID=UPI001ADC8412|nr:hypothetical protein [Sulfitobacter sp. R18_1]MBO9428659.1 hypothetical protein [Sulfitobacter sp. R18_1]
MSQKQGQDNQTEKELMVFVAFGLLCLTIWLIWTYARDFIVWFSFAVNLAQLYPASYILNFSGTELGYLEFMKGVYKGSDSPYYVDPFSITWPEFYAMASWAGRVARWVLVPIMIFWTIRTVFKMKGKGFSRQFSLAGGFGPSLADYQSQHWKVFTPGAKFDPDALSKEELPARTPMEWMRDMNIGLKDGEVDLDAAEEAFAAQLGEPWHGVEKAPAYIKGICVACFLNAKRDKNARGMKERISVIYSTKSQEEADKEIEAIFNETKEKEDKFLPAINKVVDKHAYTNTAMFRLLGWARKHGGVFASAEIRWLKPMDRVLWYALNNCGRMSFHTEGAGAVSHFHAENILGDKLVEPHVDQAVDGLIDYVENQGLMDLDKFFEVEVEF